jgi:dTDP-4-dehydrorhamnose reductase
VLSYFPKALVIRTSAPFSPWDDSNFAQSVISALQQNLLLPAANDTTVSPTYVPHLINAALDLFIDGEHGVWHLYNQHGAITWCDFAVTLAHRGGYQSKSIIGTKSYQTGWQAPRPSNSALLSTKGFLLPSLDEAIGIYLHEIKIK